MTLLSSRFSDVGVSSIRDGQYYGAALRLICGCQHQCFASIFIVDHDLERDFELRVDRLLLELAGASWRGVSTRLLIGGSRDNPAIRGAALLAWDRARELGVETRLAAASKGQSSHVKLLVADHLVLTGSHNWSHGMFGSETQDSVLLDSPALAAALRPYFDESWLRARNDEYDVSV